VHYIPLDLDKEPPEFVQQLDYLKSPFTFKRHQLPLFMTQIYHKMQIICDGASDGEEAESMEEEG
jgi:hypothetical protein